MKYMNFLINIGIKLYFHFAITSKGGIVKERLELKIEDSYNNQYKLVSSVKVMSGNQMVSEWKTDDYKATIHQGIDATDSDAFEKLKMKRKVEDVMKIFEPITVTIQPK